jgi:hypothetical protein
MWGNGFADRQGYIVEDTLARNYSVLLNTGSNTHLHVQTGTSSAIDLTICSPLAQLDLDWEVHDDLCGSDHFPILIREVGVEPVKRERRFKFGDADWILFEELTAVPDAEELLDGMDVDTAVEEFVLFLMTAAEHSIPMSSGRTPTGQRVVWWTDECTQAVNERKSSLRRYQRIPNVSNKISLSRARAKAKYVQRQARLASWRAYVSTITSDTPMSKIWTRMGKMRGKYKSPSAPCLIDQGNPVAEDDEVAKLLAEHYCSVSSGNSYSPRFQRIKNRSETAELKFKSDRYYSYNSPITYLEIQTMLMRCGNTAPGPDGIHYKMLRRCHETALCLLLAIFNRVWMGDQYPTQWCNAIILSFHKPGKPPGNVSSYLPIALTSCLGKLMDKVINSRLSQYLEYH